MHFQCRIFCHLCLVWQTIWFFAWTSFDLYLALELFHERICLLYGTRGRPPSLTPTSPLDMTWHGPCSPPIHQTEDCSFSFDRRRLHLAIWWCWRLIQWGYARVSLWVRKLVVKLWDIGQDGKAIRKPVIYDIFHIQQTWNTNLLLSYSECKVTISENKSF